MNEVRYEGIRSHGRSQRFRIDCAVDRTEEGGGREIRERGWRTLGKRIRRERKLRTGGTEGVK